MPSAARTRLSRVLAAVRRIGGVDGAAVLLSVRPEPVVVATDGLARIPRDVALVAERAGDVAVTEHGRYAAAEVPLPGPVHPGALLVHLSPHAVWDAEEHARLLECAAWAEDVLRSAPSTSASSSDNLEFAPVLPDPPRDAIVAVWGLDGVFRYVSPGFEARTGWTADELVGQSSLTFVHPDDVASLVEAGVEVLATGVNALVHRLRCRDGGYAWLEAELRLDGGGGAIRATAREIDREGRLREQLAGAERRNQQLVASLQEAVLVVRRDGVIEAANPAACEAFGVPGEQLVGRSGAASGARWLDAEGRPLRAGDTPAGVTFRTGQTVSGMLVRVRSARARRWLVASTSFLDPERVVVSMTDITDLQAARDALADREASYRMLVHALHEGIAVFDADGRVVELNAAAEPVFGLHADDVRDGPRFPMPAEIIDESGTLVLDDELPTAVARRTGQACADRVLGIRAKDRPLRWYLTSAVPLTEGRTVASLLDFTAMKAARDELEQRKDEFISTLSHEMRTPLMSLAGAISLLQAGAAGAMPEPAAPLLSVARRNSDRLVRLVNDVLDLERMLAGSLPLQLERHDLGSLVRQAADAAAPLGAHLDVGVSVDTPAEPILISTDGDRVQQILANLISNAIKFAPRGSSVEVRVSGTRGRARITVRDHGPGVPKPFRSQLFLRFSQGRQPGADRRVRGSGLGLSISRALATALGGEVGYEEPAGGGACFWVTLPRDGDQS